MPVHRSSGLGWVDSNPVADRTTHDICFASVSSVGSKFSQAAGATAGMDMCWQALVFSIEFFNQGGVVFLYELVEQSLLWVTAVVPGLVAEVGTLPPDVTASTHATSLSALNGRPRSDEELD